MLPRWSAPIDGPERPQSLCSSTRAPHGAASPSCPQERHRTLLAYGLSGTPATSLSQPGASFHAGHPELPKQGSPGQPSAHPGLTAWLPLWADNRIRARGIVPATVRRNTRHNTGLDVYRWAVERTSGRLRGLRRLRVRRDRRATTHGVFLELSRSNRENECGLSAYERDFRPGHRPAPEQPGPNCCRR